MTFSLVVDTTAPVITIDTEVADSNGYTASTTPSFDVTSDEAGTLTVGGSCSITGQDSMSASTSTTITLDRADGSTYSDCTVTVTDAAGNASNQETLTAFTVDVTSTSLTVSLASPLPVTPMLLRIRRRMLSLCWQVQNLIQRLPLIQHRLRIMRYLRQL